jgi:hypothetical protein
MLVVIQPGPSQHRRLFFPFLFQVTSAFHGDIERWNMLGKRSIIVNEASNNLPPNVDSSSSSSNIVNDGAEHSYVAANATVFNGFSGHIFSTELCCC